MKGELILVDSVFSDIDEFEIKDSVHDFCLSIYVDDDKTLEMQLKNRKSFDYCMNYSRKFREQNGSINEDEEKEIQYIEEHFDSLLDSVEYIMLNFSEQNKKDFIMKNPIVLSKKIVLDDTLEIFDYDKIMELMDEYEDIIDKVYVTLAGNLNYVSLLDCYKTICTIKKQADDIKNLNLSPMETIMYVYDQVRNRLYEFETKDEPSFKSRDLTEVMFGDKIVCAGYANIFCAILCYLGFNNRVVLLTHKNDIESGHARNVVYVKDPKYDIDGVYYFDPTWDRKRTNSDNSYLYKYSYFAKTRKFMDDSNFDFEDSSFPIYSTDMYEKVKGIIEEGNYEKLYPYVSSLNYMSRLVGQGMLIERTKVVAISPYYGQFDTELFLKKFEEIFSKFNNELSAETLIKLLNNVRKIEYYQNPEWYPYSFNDIYKTFMESKWEFSDIHLDLRTKMLRAIFGDETQEIEPIDNYVNYAHENKLFEDIQQVRLSKVLRLVYEQRK